MTDTLFLVNQLIQKRKRANKMIKYNDNLLGEINSWEDSDTYVVADFDRTLTSSTSVTSWGLFSATKKVPEGFMQKEQALYEHYRPIELDNSISYAEKNFLMNEWWTTLIMSLNEFGLTENDIDNLMTESGLITFRDGAKELFQSLAQRNIPIVIISAGLGDTIRHFLEQNGVMYPNVHIVSNFLNYENGNVKGIKGNTIHALNKSAALLSEDQQKEIAGRNHIILLGDQISDTYMVSEEKRAEALKVAFIAEGTYNDEFANHFDILCTGDTSFIDLSKEFSIFSLDGMKR